MTKQPAPRLFQIQFGMEAEQQFDLLPPRAARALHNLLRTTMRQDPEGEGLRVRGHAKGFFLATRNDFQIVYKVDHVRHIVEVLRIQSL